MEKKRSMGFADPALILDQRIKSNSRADGRTLTAMRQITVFPGTLQQTTAGSALVKLGGTKILAGVTLQVGQPREETPRKGEIGVEVHLSPICHAKYTSIQVQQEEGKALEIYIQSILLRCHIIRREDLCIREGVCVWKLNIDIQCLSHQGSLADACLLAAVAALAKVTLPPTMVTKEGGEVVIVPPDQDHLPMQLKLQRVPIPLTLGLHGSEVISDLTLAEEELIRTRITIVLDGETKQIFSIFKPGGAPISHHQLLKCISLCRQRAEDLKIENNIF